jgi:hypothetical protein
VNTYYESRVAHMALNLSSESKWKKYLYLLLPEHEDKILCVT